MKLTEEIVKKAEKVMKEYGLTLEYDGRFHYVYKGKEKLYRRWDEADCIIFIADYTEEKSNESSDSAS